MNHIITVFDRFFFRFETRTYTTVERLPEEKKTGEILKDTAQNNSYYSSPSVNFVWVFTTTKTRTS